jgi:hypothetical protein
MDYLRERRDEIISGIVVIAAIGKEEEVPETTIAAHA